MLSKEKQIKIVDKFNLKYYYGTSTSIPHGSINKHTTFTRLI